MFRMLASGMLILSLMPFSGCQPAGNGGTLDQLANPVTRASVAHEYWNTQGLSPLINESIRTVALTEFIVEFVVTRVETSTVTTTESAATDPSLPGLGATLFEFGREIHETLADRMHDLFVEELERRGFEIVPIQVVSRTDAYQKFAVSGGSQSGTLQSQYVAGSDLGRILSTRIAPATGYRTIIGSRTRAPIERTELDLLSETGADASLRVRFRVGVARHSATLEVGSVISVVGRQGVGSMTATRSLLSDSRVVNQLHESVDTRLHMIDPIRYNQAIERIFPPYAAMGFDLAMN